jgi:pimeloyl-ACP methyl ester carboxylesterase
VVFRKEKGSGYGNASGQRTGPNEEVSTGKAQMAAQDGPAILVGHSYGGVVITEAGNDPKVTGLVYIAAFAPDKGESVAAAREARESDPVAARRLFVARQGSGSTIWLLTGNSA